MRRVRAGFVHLWRWIVRAWNRAKSPASLVYVLANGLIAVGGYALAAANDDGAAQDIGNGLIATGIAGMVVFTYILLQQESATRLNMLTQFGVKNIFAQRGVGIKEEYSSRAQVALRHIDVMGFGLNSLREDQKHNFASWANRCPVRILLLDPDAGTGSGSYAEVRDREEDAMSPGTIRREVEAFLTDTAALRASNPNFQVRLYNNIPSINIFRIDNELFFGPYFLRQPSRNTPTFLVGSGALFDSVLTHFDTIWEDNTLSRPAP